MDQVNQVRIVELKDQAEVEAALRQIKVDARGVPLMAPKGVFRQFWVRGLSVKAANLLKQQMLAVGAEAAVSEGASRFRDSTTDVLLMGTVKQYHQAIGKLLLQPFGLKDLARELRSALDNWDKAGRARQIRARDHVLALGERTLVMGILNVTPDSFSDGGLWLDPGRALEHAHQMVEDGADIIDVGAESTRPGHVPVTSEVERERLAPVLKRLVQELPRPVSIDTYRSETAQWALDQGVHIINDIWGLKKDPRLAEVAARAGAPIILMHNQDGTEYQDLMADLLTSLRWSIETAKAAGVGEEQIVTDPGIGFGKTTDQNLEVLARLKELKVLGYPILLGTSRKSVIGNTLGLPVDQRLEGTAATVALGIAFGADIVRVHDVAAMVRVARMADAIVRRRLQAEAEA